jgi:hypothetical protein
MAMFSTDALMTFTDAENVERSCVVVFATRDFEAQFVLEANRA